MSATQHYGPHHAYAEHHHVPPPPPGHHHAVAYHPQYHPPPHGAQMMPPPGPAPHGYHYVPHYGPHVHPPPGPPPQPAYGPVVSSSQSLPPTSSYTSYAPPPVSQHPGVTLPSIQAPPNPPNQEHHKMDMTGQIAPPGMSKPKVAATLWEDEGTLCFQVEANGICVTRRHDNHMINGTKLLNVAQMTRGRRDGILKGEKLRKVMKIGPMHLKGVWIPYERALDYANKEKITERLYPLFLHNIDQLLSQTNPGGPMSVANHTVSSKFAQSKEDSSSSASDATPRRAAPPKQIAAPETNGASTHHSSLPNGPHSAQPRPGLERAHTLPQPPTMASSMPLTNGGGSFEYGNAATASSHHSHYDSRSLPASPVGPPADHSVSAMPQAYVLSPTYDSRPPASGPPMPAPYSTPGYYSSSKGEMGPPARSSREFAPVHHPGYDHATYQSHAQHPIDTSVSPHSRPSPQTAPGASSASTSAHWNYPHPPPRSQTLPSSHGPYTNGYDASGSSSQGYYASTAGPSAKRARDEDDESTLVETDASQKKQKTAEAARAKYQPQRSSARR